MLTGEAVGRPMLGHVCARAVQSVAISRDGGLIVSGDRNGMVRRWDASGGEGIGEPIEGHSGIVLAVVISDDGKLIVTGSWDGTVRRWDARTGGAIGRPMKRHSDWISSLAISTDGDLNVSSSSRSLGRSIVFGFCKSMRRWNARAGVQVGSDIKVPDFPDKIVISNDGENIACASKYRDCVQKWETKTGEPRCEPMKWSEGGPVLHEMERARLCGDKECDTFVRTDTFPIEMTYRAVCTDRRKIVQGLFYGSVVVFERR